MPLYRIVEHLNQSTGRIDAEDRLVFGGLTVESAGRKNRFLLSDPHRRDAYAVLYESDIPQFLAYVLKRFKPFDESVSLTTDWNVEAKKLLKALGVSKRVFADVSGWTSKYCSDCLMQRDRSKKFREVLEFMMNGDVESQLIDAGLYGEARRISDAIQEYVVERDAERRRKEREGR